MLGDSCGLSLIEVMIAMLILGIGLLTVAAAQLSALRMGTASEHNQQALYLAQEQLERFQANTPAAGTFDDPGNPIDAFPNDRDLSTFSRGWVVLDNTPQPGLSTVRVTVAWNNPVAGVPTAQRVTLVGIVGGAAP